MCLDNSNSRLNTVIFAYLLSNVCPRYLMILLGIVKGHHDLFEEECNAFDHTVAKEIAKTDYVTMGQDFKKYIVAIRKVNQ